MKLLKSIQLSLLLSLLIIISACSEQPNEPDKPDYSGEYFGSAKSVNNLFGRNEISTSNNAKVVLTYNKSEDDYKFQLYVEASRESLVESTNDFDNWCDCGDWIQFNGEFCKGRTTVAGNYEDGYWYFEFECFQ
jgi:hypothetical protein